MISPYNSIISYEGEDFGDFFDRILLIEVFKDLIKKYSNDKPLLKCIIRYIVMAYSKDSDKIHLNSDWHKNKKRIYEDAQLPPRKEIQDAVMYLEDDVVRTTVQAWLDYQDEPIFSQLQMAKELLVEMQLSANRPIKKSSNEVDYDQKFKNAGYVNDLRVIIKDLESELIQNDSKLKDAVREMKANKGQQTISIEKYSH